MSTYADVITRARHFLQDVVSPVRNTDAELELYLADGLGEMYRLRPDIFPSAGCDDPVPTWVTTADTFPLDSRWILPLAYFVAGNAELKDDPHATDGKAAALLSLAQRAWGVAL
jgi:hypothetical protein